MRDEIIGIRHAVALDVGSLRMYRVRPPVIALGEEVVITASAARTARGRNGDRLFFQIASAALRTRARSNSATSKLPAQATAVNRNSARVISCTRNNSTPWEGTSAV